MNAKLISFGNKSRERSLNNVETRHISSKTEHDTTLSQQYTKNIGVLEKPDFFTPTTAPVFVDYNGNKIEAPEKKAVVNADTGELVSIVGANYNLVTNADIFAQFDEALSESSIDLEGAYKTVHVCRGGAQTILGYSFPAYETTITDREVGDVIRLSVTCNNSYDGFSMFSALFQEVRLICMNSMVSGTGVSYYAGKHTASLNVEKAAEKITQAIDVFCKHGDLYKRWANTKVTDEQAEKLFQKLSQKKGYKTEFNEKRAMEHMEQWHVEKAKLGSNRWALYNALTHWATHAKVQERVIAAGNERVRQKSREDELRKFLNTQTDWFKEVA